MGKKNRQKEPSGGRLEGSLDPTDPHVHRVEEGKTGVHRSSISAEKRLHHLRPVDKRGGAAVGEKWEG